MTEINFRDKNPIYDHIYQERVVSYSDGMNRKSILRFKLLRT